MFGLWGKKGSNDAWDEISSRELRTRMAGKEVPIIIDVREGYEYEQGHIPGARLMPLGSFVRKLVTLEKSAPYVLVCASGSRSRRAAGVMVKAGFTKVANLRAGMMEWDGKVER